MRREEVGPCMVPFGCRERRLGPVGVFKTEAGVEALDGPCEGEGIGVLLAELFVMGDLPFGHAEDVPLQGAESLDFLGRDQYRHLVLELPSKGMKGHDEARDGRRLPIAGRQAHDHPEGRVPEGLLDHRPLKCSEGRRLLQAGVRSVGREVP